MTKRKKSELILKFFLINNRMTLISLRFTRDRVIFLKLVERKNFFRALGWSISYTGVYAFATYLIPSLENIPVNCWGVHVYARATSNYTHVCFTCAHTLSPDKETGCNARKSGTGCERVGQRGEGRGGSPLEEDESEL